MLAYVYDRATVLFHHFVVYIGRKGQKTHASDFEESFDNLYSETHCQRALTTASSIVEIQTGDSTLSGIKKKLKIIFILSFCAGLESRNVREFQIVPVWNGFRAEKRQENHKAAD